MENKRELIKKAKQLGIDTTGLTKSQLQDSIEAKAKDVPEPESESESKTKLEASTSPTPAMIIKKRRKKAKGDFPKHLAHGIMQPGPHGLSTGG